jgi:hypothetical protein
MAQCSGCGCPLPYAFKSCGACAQNFFKQIYTPLAIQKLIHCAKCRKLEMCEEQADLWFCQRCKPAETVRKSVQDGLVQKVEKPPATLPCSRLPKQPRKIGYKPPKLSCNVCESDRKMVLAQRVFKYLQDAGGRLWLSKLGRRMNGYRYPEWQAAVNLLITVGAAQIKPRGRHSELVQTGIGTSLSRWRLRRPRKRRRSRRQSIWFQEHVLGK